MKTTGTITNGVILFGREISVHFAMNEFTETRFNIPSFLNFRENKWVH